jgi:hypothetical protein
VSSLCILQFTSTVSTFSVIHNCHPPLPPHHPPTPQSTQPPLHCKVDTCAWSDTCDSLCAVADSRFLVWYYPNVVFVDRDLLAATSVSKDASDLGKQVSAGDGSGIGGWGGVFPTLLKSIVPLSLLALRSNLVSLDSLTPLSTFCALSP